MMSHTICRKEVFWSPTDGTPLHASKTEDPLVNTRCWETTWSKFHGIIAFAKTMFLRFHEKPWPPVAPNLGDSIFAQNFPHARDYSEIIAMLQCVHGQSYKQTKMVDSKLKNKNPLAFQQLLLRKAKKVVALLCQTNLIANHNWSQTIQLPLVIIA